MEKTLTEKKADDMSEGMKIISEAELERYEIFKDLNDKQKHILRVIVENPGMSKIEIGKAVGLHRNNVTKHMQSYEFRRALRYLNLSFNQLLEVGYEKTVRRLIDIIDSRDGKMALDASKILMKLFLDTRATQGDQQLGGIVFTTSISEDGIITQTAEKKFREEKLLKGDVLDV